ncbi:MAG: hypothetical protein ACKVYV_09070, partial [Limisphaerales bacterium]
MRLPLLLAVLAALTPLLGTAAENTAEVRLFCLSVRVHQGTTGGGLGATLDMFSGNDPGTPNGELWPLIDDPDFTHTTAILFADPVLNLAIPGALALNVPEDTDANGDGVPDFYQVAQASPLVIGDGAFAFDDDFDFGPASGSWSRAAGQRTGSLELQLNGVEFGSLPPFQHLYEIIEFAGTLKYVPGGGTITGRVDLAQVENPAATLRGPVVLKITATNAFEFDESNLTNQLGQTVRVSLGLLDMDPDYAFDYFGAFSFLDGDPATPEVDYELFLIGVDDPNDANGNGIPDLTDPPAVGAPSTLAITLLGANAISLSL